MENPLTLEEKVAVPRLIGHDLVSHYEDAFAVLAGVKKLSPEVLYAKNRHVRMTLAAITILTTYTDDCYFGSVRSVELTSPTIPRLFDGNSKVEWFNQIKSDFIGSYPILYAALYNLIKNGFRAMDGKGVIRVSIDSFDKPSGDNLYGRPYGSLVYVPNWVSSSYTRFDVHDTGHGFPKDIPLEQNLALGVSGFRGGTGFGLHFVSLACKFLRAPLGIVSQPGNTHVTIYHPTNLKK